MNTLQEEPPRSTPVKRPPLVWVISILYFISAGTYFLSLALIFSGAASIDAQSQYFQSLTVLDHAVAFVAVALNLLGAVFLLLLKKPAFWLFLAAFGIDTAAVIYQIFAKHWLDANEGPNLAISVITFCISIGVILYSKRLVGKGILK